MDELMNMIKDKIELLIGYIDEDTSTEIDLRESQAIHELAEALWLLDQLKEETHED